MSKAINVLISRNAKGDTVENVAAAPVVRGEELRATGSALDNLTRNVLAGKVSAPIQKAVDNNDLPSIMPGDALKNQRSALRFLLSIPAPTIRDKWAAYCKGRERVTPPTLQRLANECKPEKEPREPRITVADIVNKWDEMPQEWREAPEARDFFDLINQCAPA